MQTAKEMHVLTLLSLDPKITSYYEMPLLPSNKEERPERPVTPVIPVRNFDDYEKYLEATKLTLCHESLMPSKEWIYEEADKFRELRHYVKYIKTKEGVPIKVLQGCILSCKNWDWKKIFETKEPTLSYLLGFHDNVIYTGLTEALDMIYDIPHGEMMTTKFGQWLYSLMVFVDDDMVRLNLLPTLRKIARHCARLRSYIDHEREEAPVLAASYNLIICIVNKHYKQHDIGF